MADENIIQPALTPEQSEVNDLMSKIQILSQVKKDFEGAIGENISGVSFLFQNRIITLKSYLNDTSQYTEAAGNALNSLSKLIDSEISSHNQRIATLNNIINPPQQPAQGA